MPVVLAAMVAAATATLPVCSWDRPGADPFGGDIVAAVDHYADIPPATRAALKARMTRRGYDDLAVIRRDAIEGRHRYAELRDMHFGRGRLCQRVTRAGWSPQAEELGLVYCEDGHCLIVPTACRNLSRVTRLAAEPQVAALPAAPAFPAAPAAADELEFEPPAAGPGSSFSDGLGDAPSDDVDLDPDSDHGDPEGAPWGPTGPPVLPGGVVIVPAVPPPVPEPPAWGLLIAGLGLIGLAKRRGRRRMPTHVR